MRARLIKTVLVALIATSAMAASCFSITDPFVVAVNLEDIRSTYAVTPGTINFNPGCITKNPSDYIDANFNVAGGGQLVDIIIQTNGTFAGNIVNGQLRIGGSTQALQTLATYSGPWSAFNTPQSLLQNDGTMTLNASGVNTLLSLIENTSPIVICHSGSFSQAATANMAIDVTIFAQVNATP
ncbi:MAG TPA: hypothetical protein VFZ73_16680 [Gemmatimonadaceae bacterium]